MPVEECQKDGEKGYRWGPNGVCFPGEAGREKAAAVGRAIHAQMQKEIVSKAFPNEHAARQVDPGDFVRFNRVKGTERGFPAGIDLIFGIRRDNTSAIQSVRFDREKWTPTQAKKWLHDHDMNVGLFEEATEKEGIIKGGIEKLLLRLRKAPDVADDVVQKSWLRLHVDYAKVEKGTEDEAVLVGLADLVMKEMHLREMTYATENSLGAAVAERRASKDDYFELEGGAHPHELDRAHSKTFKDGRHRHAWVIEGVVVMSEEDGDHEHGMENPTAVRTSSELSAHKHKVRMPDGSVLETEDGGAHEHEAMVNCTTPDGMHEHVLMLPDGSSVRSYNAGQLWAVMNGFQVPTAGQAADSLAEQLTEGEADKGDHPKYAEAAILKFERVRVGKQANPKMRVTGVVLEPLLSDDGKTITGRPDTQGDVMTVEDIEEAAVDFMKRGGVVGFRHKKKLLKAQVVESYIAPVDMVVNGQKVRAGSWIITVDLSQMPEIWGLVESGEINAFSVGGFGVREEVQAA